MPELLDRYHRKIDYLRLSITDRCNLRCRYCMPKQGVKHLPRKEILSYEEIIRIAQAALRCGITKIRITGGEPLTRKGIIYFLHQLHSVASPIDITLTTNGILLAEYAPALVAAGVKRINISLDTLKSEKFRFITCIDSFDKVWAGINAAETAGLSPIKINCVVIKGFNEEEVVDFAGLTLSHPYQVRFIEFMPIGERDFWGIEKVATAPEIKRMIQHIYTLEPVSHGSINDGTAQRFKIPGAMGEIGFISPLSGHFCEMCNRIRLTPDGKLRNCLFSDQEIDIKAALRSGVSEKEMEGILVKSIRQKPSGHKLNKIAPRKCKRSMWEIGG